MLLQKGFTEEIAARCLSMHEVTGVLAAVNDWCRGQESNPQTLALQASAATTLQLPRRCWGDGRVTLPLSDLRRTGSQPVASLFGHRHSLRGLLGLDWRIGRELNPVWDFRPRVVNSHVPQPLGSRSMEIGTPDRISTCVSGFVDQC